ncbi:MAG: hypothetical protein ABIG63_11275, partial [Chloroflexota bacterium]
MKKLILFILLVSAFYAIPTDVQAIPPDSYGPYTISVFSASVSFIRDTLSIAEVIPATSGRTLRNYWVTMLYSVNPALINQSCRILKHTAESSTLICDTTGGIGGSADIGFSANYAVGDIIIITQSPPANALIRGAVTATKIATGVNERDAALYEQNSIDSFQVDVAGAAGIADWSALTSTKAGTNGASMAEAQLYDHVLLDTLTTIKAEYIEQMDEDMRDSLAVGQAAQRRDVARDSVLVKANTTLLDTIAGKSYG